MGSISSPVSSLYFNGQSSFSSDLQTELNTEVQNASAPIQQMQSDVSLWQNQQQALSSLESAFNSLTSAAQAIGSTSSGSLTANVSDPSVATATAGVNALPGTYTLQVIAVGTPTTMLSNAGLNTVTDPSQGDISNSTSLTLTVNNTPYNLTLTGNNLNALASAINGSAAGVQATIVNVGGSAKPDYRLALTSTDVGDISMQLSDGTNTNLLGTIATGQPAEYSVDGSTETVQSSTNRISLAPGVTVNLDQANSSPVTITVSADYSAIGAALSNFASAYNSAESAVSGQIGQNAGPLSGQDIVYSLRDALSSLVNYNNGSTGGVSSLASLGLTLDSTGNMDFDSATFASLSPSQVQNFLGNATSTGFLKSAQNTLSSAADPTTGAIQTENNTLQGEITSENALISSAQARVNDMATNLENELSQADATIANLQTQKSYFTELFQAEYPGTSG